jgi:hypothetical protein
MQEAEPSRNRITFGSHTLQHRGKILVDVAGIEPAASSLRTMRSPS